MAESDGELDTSAMVARVNRKRKSAGGWQAMGLDHKVGRGIERRGYKAPSPIQRKAIPILLDGKDIVAMSRTGSGKTAAFIVPMLQKLKCRQAKTGCRALLISPTRELALQTFRFVKELGRFTGLRAAVVVGGDAIEEQFTAVHTNPDILIATPGRLLHLIMEMSLKLESVQYVVFDEADRLFEMGFAEQLNEVIRRLPDNRQTSLFSATLPKSLIDFTRAGLNDPVLVRLDVDSKISDALDMQFLLCRAEEKLGTLLHLLSTLRHDEQCIVFVATKHHVEYLREIIQEAQYSCTYLYSSLDSFARKINLNRFRYKESQILVVTDVAARGVDIPLLDCIINFHFPPKPKLFVHRVGRVARAGRSGRAISLISSDEQPYMLDLFLFLGRKFQVATEGVKGGDVVGTLSRDVVESSIETITNVLQTTKVDWAALKKVSENAYKHYMKSKPEASMASIRRLKVEKLFAEVQLHPMFEGKKGQQEEARNELLEGLKNYKPQLTVFEFNTSSKGTEWSVMKSKRLKHEGIIEKAKRNAPKKAKVDEMDRPNTSAQCSEQDIEDTFSSVIAPKFREDFSEVCKSKRLKKNERRRETESKEYFVPYAPQDVHTEAGLAVEKGFEGTANAAVVDFMGDETETIRQQQQGKKTWDRKKKKFVGPDESKLKKKIRTETGALIPASYLGDKYSKWKNKQKIGTNEQLPLEMPRGNRKWRYSKEQMEAGKPKNERKRPEQILKERKRKQKIQSFQKSRYNEKRNKKGTSATKGKGRKR